MIHIREGPVESWGICAYEADKSLRTVRSARLRYCSMIYYFQGHRYLWHDDCLLRGSADIKLPYSQQISSLISTLFLSHQYLCDYLNLYIACYCEYVQFLKHTLHLL